MHSKRRGEEARGDPIVQIIRCRLLSGGIISKFTEGGNSFVIAFEDVLQKT